METINYKNTQNKFTQFIWKLTKRVVLPLFIFSLSINAIITVQERIQNKHIALYNAFFTPPTTAAQKAKDYEIRYNFAKKFSKYFSQEERKLIINKNIHGDLRNRVFKFINEKYIEHIVAPKKCAYYHALFDTPVSTEQEEQFFKTRCDFIQSFENEFTEEEKACIAAADIDNPLCNKIVKLIQNKFMELL